MSSPCILVYQLPNNNFTLTLPLYGGTASSINWGDGNITTDDNRIHTYATAGTYTIQVDGSGITSMNQTTGGSNSARTYLTGCTSFGEIGLTSLNYAFWGCSILTSAPSSLPSTSIITEVARIFDGASIFNQNVSGWNVSNVTNFSGMFFVAQLFNNGDSGNNGANPLSWGSATLSATDMSDMFHNAYAFNQRVDGWDVTNVTIMSNMFNNAYAFNNGDPANNQAQPLNWGIKTGNVTNMYGMFEGANAFNQDISGWSTGSCQNMSYMFRNATLFNQNLNQWNVSSVTNMSYMFSSVNAFNSNLNQWIVSSVTNMEGMFNNADAFNNGDAGNNQANPLSWGTNTSQVTNMYQMFRGAYVFNQNVSGWNVTAVTNMENMFRQTPLFNQDVSSWVPSSVTTMHRMFRDALVFNNGDSGNNQSKPLTSWGTHLGNVTDMGGMFRDAQAFNQDVSNWNVSSVENISDMFEDAFLFNQNIGGWNVSNVTSFGDFIRGTALSIANYNALWNGWSQRSVQEYGIYFLATGLLYSSAGQAARHLMETTYNWNITGDLLTSVNPITTNTNVTFTITASQDAMNDYLSNGNQYQLVNASDNVPISGIVTLDTSPDYPELVFTNVTFSTSGTKLTQLYNVTGNFGVLDFPYRMIVSGGIPCFKEGSTILTMEGYLPIEQLRKGDQVLTSHHGFKAIDMIGKRVIEHVASEERIKDQLYVLSTSKYPELKEDLIITGCHSILVDHFEEGEKEKTAAILGANYVTDGKYRLPACVDQRTTVYTEKGNHTIYHIALEHTDYYMNYGVYANGLLVETTSKRYMKELSEMTLIA